MVFSQFSNSQLGSVISHVRPPNKDIYRYLLNQYFLLSSRQPMSLTIELVLRISWYLAGVVEYRRGFCFSVPRSVMLDISSFTISHS